MGIIWTILIGFVVGLIARAIVPGSRHMGFIMTAILGVAGSLLASFGVQALFQRDIASPAGLIASVIGAVILLFVYGKLSRKR